MELVKNAVASELASWKGFQAAELSAEKLIAGLARPPKPDMGDLTFATFRFAKPAGLNPAEMANSLLVDAPTSGVLITSATAAGPYLNLTLDRKAVMAAVLSEIESKTAGDDPDQWAFGYSDAGTGKTLVVDLSSPNIAKPLAVHHLRSTMIGNSVKKIRESQGWRVVGVNHLGDWGTGFGKLIAGIKRYFPDIAERAKTDEQPLGDMTVQELNEAYARINREAKDDETLAQAGKTEFSVLERYIEALLSGTQEETGEQGLMSFRIWQNARELSLAEFERMYAALGLSFHLWPVVVDAAKQKLESNPAEFYREHGIYVGESYYVTAEDLVKRLIVDATESKVAEEDEGALVIFTHGKKKPPLMLLKNDGATSYHARDMASALYRTRHWNADELAYVVGGEQSLHFKQLFKALEMLGHDWAKRCSHTDFGLMLFMQENGKWEKSSTRKGTSIMLEDLLDESIAAVRDIIKEKNEELAADEAEAELVAHAVGVGAVVFNDLKNGRRNNVKFDWDAVLDFKGESGPYMQMQYVRMCAVTRKFETAHAGIGASTGCVSLLELDEEWKIVAALAEFPAVLEKASRELEPSVVARWLIELAGLTSSWWAATKDTRIVSDDPDLSCARIRLVTAVRKAIGQGLTLLGIPLVNRM
ncbi:MAG: arginine--tRNA ligase [Planctomycetota bacterium]|jgi:arginyl-tRNA synthetase